MALLQSQAIHLNLFLVLSTCSLKSTRQIEAIVAHTKIHEYLNQFKEYFQGDVVYFPIINVKVIL